LHKDDGGARKALGFFNMGMGRTVLSQTLFAELGLDRDAPFRYAIANAEFETGAETVDAAKADFTGLSLDQMFAPRKVDAILSPSLLRDRLLVIDYGRRRLAVAAPGTLEPEGVPAPINLNTQTGLVTIDVDVAGGRHAFVIDAGSGYCWMRGERLKEWLAAAPDWRRAEGAIGRANYNMIDFAFEKQGTVARLPEIAIGEVTLPNIGVLGTGACLANSGTRYSVRSSGTTGRNLRPGPSLAGSAPMCCTISSSRSIMRTACRTGVSSRSQTHMTSTSRA
jgi:hypothetical protein